MRSCSQSICIILREQSLLGSSYSPSARCRAQASCTNDNTIFWRISIKRFSLTRGGVVRHKRRWSVIYEGDVGSAWEWCQIKLHTSCDVPAMLNQLKTTVVDGARSIFTVWFLVPFSSPLISREWDENGSGCVHYWTLLVGLALLYMMIRGVVSLMHTCDAFAACLWRIRCMLVTEGIQHHCSCCAECLQR